MRKYAFFQSEPLSESQKEGPKKLSLFLVTQRAGFNSGVGVEFNSNSGVGIGVAIAGVGVGIGVAILDRTWSWSWNWSCFSLSWNCYHQMYIHFLWENDLYVVITSNAYLVVCFNMKIHDRWIHSFIYDKKLRAEVKTLGFLHWGIKKSSFRYRLGPI